MKFSGHGTINIFGTEKRCSIELDIMAGTVTVRFSNANVDLPLNPNWNSAYSITNLEIPLPTGSIRDCKIPNLKLMDWNVVGGSIYESDLVRTFSLHKPDTGLCRVVFRPKKGQIKLPIKSFTPITRSELVFSNSIIRTRKRYAVNFGRFKTTIVGDKSILVIRSSGKLKTRERSIVQALSIMQQGRICLLATIQEHMVTLNFNAQNNVEPEGRVVGDVESEIEFLEKYVKYDLSIKGNERAKFRLFSDYVINGCASLESLEARVIALFTAVEIVDESDTLNKSSFSNTLNVTNQDGDISVKVRNKLIHEGLTVGEAIKKSIDTLKNHDVEINSSWYRKSDSGVSSGKRFHQFLLDKVLRYICSRIEFSLDCE